MAKKKRKIWIPLVILIFIAYIFLAAQPIRQETVLKSRWLTSLENRNPGAQALGTPIPFLLGNRFGYTDNSGNFFFNKNKEGIISLSPDRWAEFDQVPGTIEVKSPLNEIQFTISNPAGYPFFMDGRNFILGKDQNSIQSLNDHGIIQWTYDFDAPITCIDANAGLLFVGLLDGNVELINSSGQRIFFFEALGSRILAVYGCRISSDGSRLAIVSGLDEQRFLLFDRQGDSYKVTYHEYIGEGFRRPVLVSFIDQDRRVVYERKDGIGIYDTQSRQSTVVPLDGTVYALDTKGTNDMLFVITSLSEQKKNLVMIRYPGIITGQALFKSNQAFLDRRDSELIIGGGSTLISFELEKR